MNRILQTPASSQPETRHIICRAREGDAEWNIEQEVRIHTGETLILYSPKNELIANDCVLLPSKPEHHGDKSELLTDLTAFLHRYVDLSPLFEQIAAHHVLLTWVHDAFNEVPYLRLRGEYGTGKTRGLLAIGSLCYRPSSPAALPPFRPFSTRSTALAAR